MTTVTERLALLVTMNPDNAVRGLGKLERESARSIGKTDERIENMGNQLTRAGAAMLSVGVVAGVGLNRAADAASDLNESINLTEQVFGAASAQMGAFARQAPSALGQSERAAREASADFGLLLNNMGLAADETVRWSKDLTVLASDMASFKNTTPEEAVLALGAAIRGESEPIRRYGVMLDDASVRAKAVELGLAATTAEVDDHGKAQARLAIIMEDTATLQGDFARTANEGANAQRVAAAQAEQFQANIGQTAAVIKAEFMGAAADMLGWFNELDPATQQTIAKFATLGTGTLVLAGGISSAAGAAIKMRNNLRTLGTGLRSMSLRAGAATAAVGLLALAWVEYRRKQAEAEERVDSMVDALEELGDTGSATASFVAQLAEEDDNLRETMLAAGLTAEELASAIAGTDSEWQAFIEAADRAATSTEGADFALERASRTLEEVRDSVQAGREEFHELEQVTDSTAETIGRNLASALSDIRGSFEDDLEEPADDAAEAVAGVEESLRDLVEFMLESANSHIAQARLLDDIAEAAGEINEVSYADARTELDTLTTDFADAVGDMVSEGRKTEDIREFVNTGATALRDLATDAGFGADEIGRLNDALALIDGKVVSASVQTRFFQDINRGPSYDVTPTPVARSGVVARSTGGPIRGRAIVGERGPEEFEGVGMVRSAAETRLARSTTPSLTQNFYGPQSPAEIEAATRWAFRTSPR